MFPLKYEGDVFRPPSEARSLILQATVGCSHNRCTFCAMYKRKKYRERELDEIMEEIALTSRLMPRTRRVFLADGNALAMKTEKLLRILQQLEKSFPALERVSLYGNPQDMLQKSTAELRDFKQNKLGIIYLGIESGSAAVLEAVNKGVTPREIAAGAARAKEAGVPLSITVINGLAGADGSAGHARDTARLLNEIDPEYLGLLSLMAVPGTTLHRRIRKGLFSPPGPWDLLKEIQMIVSDLRLTDCVFRANHASNYLPLKTVLSREQEKLLADLNRIIEQKAPGSLKSEYLRGL